jgi:hypothetical protein
MMKFLALLSLTLALASLSLVKKDGLYVIEKDNNFEVIE